MRVFAHRGYSGLYPENTMLAFDKAREAGCKAMELDVHLSKDGHLVIIHDEMLDRTTNAKGLVCSYALSELQTFNAGTAEEFQPIPSLETYCKWAKEHGIFTNIEIKTNLIYYPLIEDKVLAMLKKYGLVEHSLISSFNHGSVIRMRQLSPEIQCAFLVGGRGLANVGSYAKNFKVEYYHPDGAFLTKAAVDECKAQGVGLNVWTIDDLGLLQKMITWNVDGVFTNHCAPVLALVGE